MMKTSLNHLLFCILAIFSAQALARDLAPPDVDFYAELHRVKSDYGDFSSEDSDGFRVLGGMKLNETKWFGWNVAVEGGISRLGEAKTNNILVRAPTALELNSQPTLRSITAISTDKVEINTLQGGVKLSEGENLYLRLGVELHDLKRRSDPLNIQYFTNKGPQILLPADSTDSESRLFPYAGIGLQIPLGKRMKLIGDYSAYRVDNELINTLGIGFAYHFGTQTGE